MGSPGKYFQNSVLPVHIACQSLVQPLTIQVIIKIRQPLSRDPVLSIKSLITSRNGRHEGGRGGGGWLVSWS